MKPGENTSALKAIGGQVSTDTFYGDLYSRGLQYGAQFRAIRSLWCEGDEARAEIELQTAVSPSDAPPLPLIDGCLQTLLALVPEHGDAAYVPVALGRLHQHRPLPARVLCHARRQASTDGARLLEGDLTVTDPQGNLVLQLDGLRLMRVTSRELLGERAFQGLYTLGWHESTAPDAPEDPTSRHWIVLGDEGGVGQALVLQLQQRGASCVLLGRTERGEGDAQASAVRALLEQAPSGQPLGLVYLWGLDSAQLEPGEPDPLARVSRGCAGALAAVQALASAGAERDLALWLVTRAAQVEEAALAGLALAQAPLWGLGRSVVLELPRLHCRQVDLDPSRPAQDAASQLAQELCRQDAESEVLLRGDRRLVSRLEHHPAAASPALGPLPAEGRYLITGGLGGLGLSVARLLVSRGARHLALLGRSAPAAAARAEIARLERQGAQIAVEQVDVSSRQQLADVLERLRAVGPPLLGVVHSAGVLDDGVLSDQSWERFERVMAPKVAGAWHLHDLTRDDGLQLFWLFASQASLLGAAGQANYAAGNAFLDALAVRRQRDGHPALSVDWGPWSEVGMAAQMGQTEQRRLLQMGMSYISPEQGTLALEGAVALARPQVGAMLMDWERYVQRVTAGVAPAMLDQLLATEAPQAGLAAAKGERPAMLAVLEEASPARRRKLLTSFVKEKVAEVLGFDDMSQIGEQSSLMELGVDSLLAVDLRGMIGGQLGASLPASLIFDYPTVAAVVDFLQEQLPSEAPASAPPKRQPVVRAAPVPVTVVPSASELAVEEQLEGLGREELDRLIDAELAALERDGLLLDEDDE